jgi:hypothetical protein
MASLLLGGIGSGIGASIGGSFLGMSASSIGWMLGSSLGNLIFAEKQHVYGPRLKGDRFTGSALGQVRPIVYGTCKVEGKIIWQTPYHEHEHTEDSGGKGGGGTEYTTYTYTRSFAIMLCEGTIEAVRKIWINGKLEFDFSENSNVAAGMQSGTKINDIKFYYGTDTQLPDPTIESFDGAGNVPAYRGTAYIVFNEYDVTESSGACPVVEVEVVAKASLATQSALGLFITDDPYSWGGIGYVNEGVLYFQTESQLLTDPFSIVGIDLSNGNIVYKQDYPNIHPGPYEGSQRGAFCDDQYQWYFLGTDLNAGPTPPYYETASVTYGAKLLEGATSLYGVRLLYNKDGSITQVANYGGWRSNGTMEKFRFKRGVDKTYLYATSIDENPDEKRWIQRWDMPENVASKRYDFPDSSASLRSYPSDDGNVYVYTTDGHKLYKFDHDLNVIESKSLPGSINIPEAIAYDMGIIWFCENLGSASGNAIITAYNYSDMSVIGSVNNLSYGTTERIGDRTWSVYASGNSLAITIEGKLWTVSTNRVTRQSVPLSEIIADLHQRCGQTIDDYDVSALTDDVRGYLITEQLSSRSCIEQLQIGFLFDAKDSEGRIKYVKRGASPVETLSADDLGAFENEPVSEWQITRQQEEELPQTLSIVYMDYDGSYEKAAQNSTRQAVLSGDITTFQVPIVYKASEAQSVAQKQQMAAWVGRTKYKFTTNMEWEKLEPCDVVAVQDKVVRIVSRNGGVNGIIEFEAVAEIPSIYTNTGVGALPSGYSEETLTARGPTVFEVMDIPPLSDSDYDMNVVYISASGVLSGWPSAAIMKSSDGTSYSLLALITTASIMGYAEDVLGNWTGGNVFDEKNSVTIRTYGNGTLSSVTFDDALNREFVFLLGNEIIYGRNATLVATNLYKITGLLRGRIGTEWAMDEHVSGERFVLLDENSLRRTVFQNVDLDLEKFYKGVTSGNKISNATPKSLTYAGNSQKPLSPVSIGGGTTGLGTDWVIRWIGRTRYDWEWRDSVDAGRDEGQYDFEVRIYNDPDTPTTVLRTITVTNTTASGGFFSTAYSNSNQITDFGAHQKRLAVSVRQIGADRDGEWSEIVTINSGYSSSSKLLMHMDGSNASTSFIDEYGHAITANGNAQISTAQSKFGGASGLFDGTGDYLFGPELVDFQLADGDFTVEIFIRPATLGAGTNVQTIFDFRPDSTNGVYPTLLYGSAGDGKLYFYTNSANRISGVTALSTNTWYHVALVRYSGVTKLYLNGVQEGSNYTDSNFYFHGQTLIGGNAFRSVASDTYFNGFMDEMRITKGIARYTANFTPPSSAFTE